MGLLSVFKFNTGYMRAGQLEGLFIATPEEVEAIRGKEIYFGEVLGKHSEVIVEINDENVVFVTDDQDAVNYLKHYELEVGYNPLDYVEDDEYEES